MARARAAALRGPDAVNAASSSMAAVVVTSALTAGLFEADRRHRHFPSLDLKVLSKAIVR